MDGQVDYGRTFLLGVGCQKGGTTWLHDYLSRSPQVDLGFGKEYHIFDALDVETSRAQFDKVRRRKDMRNPGDPNYEALQKKYAFLTNLDNYFDYFASLLAAPGISVTGDITPAYSALSAERYRFIKDRFEARGIYVKVIFLMRDPVERVWSSIRMRLRNRAERNPDSGLVKKGDEDLLLKSYRLPNHALRTNYHRTIANLESVFPPEAIHYEFYERLFADDAVHGICDFLGIDYVDPAFDKKINASPKTAEISPETARLVAGEYRDVYAFAVDRFGRDDIARIWPHLASAGI